MRPFGVVIRSPLLDDDFGLFETIEDFSVEQFIPEFAVKALVVTVFPGAAGFDDQGPAQACSRRWVVMQDVWSNINRHRTSS